MYLKLALRNVKRSVFDYLLYFFSMTALTAIMCISNCIANLGKMEAGFQTMSLPLLIVVIMAALANSVNTFMVKQRAKEFATYMLLGMEKDKLALAFLGELSIIGILCLMLGAVFGAGICLACFPVLSWGMIGKSVLETFLYFGFAEILSLVWMRQKVYQLEIIQLMHEKNRNQPLKADRKSFWGMVFFISFLGFCCCCSVFRLCMRRLWLLLFR